MADDLHQPIALRRPRRGQATQEADAAPSSHAVNSHTPARKTKPKKKVRFSDPGPDLDHLLDVASTGLTPMIRRTAITPKPKRRHSTPARPANGNGLGNTCDQDSPSVSEIHFLPLRQVLDGRIKRRIRRNGLSEEMNTINAEKRQKIKATKAELERLRLELEEKDEEIRRMQDETHVFDTDRVWELEQQVDSLKKQLELKSRPHDLSSSPSYNWTVAARDPFSDDYTMLDAVNNADEEEFGDTTMADLACSTPSRRARNSFPTPPATSPTDALPMTPCSHRARATQSHTAVQVMLPDPETRRLEEELESLRLEIGKLTSTLEGYSGVTARMSDKLAAFELPMQDADRDAIQDAATSPNAEIEVRLNTLLRTLSDRTVALLDLSSSLSDLGFPGSDASDIISSISSAFRTARLELEYLTPGEIALPLTSAGAAVLDLLLDRLRDLSKKSQEADDAIDEYHALELSLRQQLGSRVEAMDGMAREISGLQSASKQKDGRISELEVSVDRLKGAVRTYSRDMAELESLIQRMEGELETATATIEAEQETHKQAVQSRTEELSSKTTAIADLESKLAAASTQSESLEAQLAEMQSTHSEALIGHAHELASQEGQHKTAVAGLNRTHGAALALRDARVAELRAEVDRVNGALRAAHETIRSLRVDNGRLLSERDGLSTRLADEKRRAKEAIDKMKGELQRVVRMSEGFLLTPKKPKAQAGRVRDSGIGGMDEDGAVDEDDVALLRVPGSMESPTPGEFLSGDRARKSAALGKKRRRYDSGMGFLDEEEV